MRCATHVRRGTLHSGDCLDRGGKEPYLAAYDLSGGDWKRLKATIGVDIDPGGRESGGELATPVVFVVRGDGKELYTSPPFGVGSKPVNIDVDVSGINKLELEGSLKGVGRRGSDIDPSCLRG
jgi:hypothetical protein